MVIRFKSNIESDIPLLLVTQTLYAVFLHLEVLTDDDRELSISDYQCQFPILGLVGNLEILIKSQKLDVHQLYNHFLQLIFFYQVLKSFIPNSGIYLQPRDYDIGH